MAQPPRLIYVPPRPPENNPMKPLGEAYIPVAVTSVQIATELGGKNDGTKSVVFSLELLLTGEKTRIGINPVQIRELIGLLETCLNKLED